MSKLSVLTEKLHIWIFFLSIHKAETERKKGRWVEIYLAKVVRIDLFKKYAEFDGWERGAPDRNWVDQQNYFGSREYFILVPLTK